MSKQTLTVKKIASAIGRKKDQDKTLIGLGLRKIGQERVLEDTLSVRGMIRKVSHLVRII
jgi:large subunit ribosomal protein L30